MKMTYRQITSYLDTLPGVLALWWFMENVNDEHPYRTELFFYCRERVRQYQGGDACWRTAMLRDVELFEEMS